MARISKCTSMAYNSLRLWWAVPGCQVNPHPHSHSLPTVAQGKNPKRKSKGEKTQTGSSWVSEECKRKGDAEVIPHHFPPGDVMPSQSPSNGCLGYAHPQFPLPLSGQEWCMWHDVSLKISGKKKNWLLEAMQPVNAWVCWPLSIVRTKSNVVQQGVEMFFYLNSNYLLKSLFHHWTKEHKGAVKVEKLLTALWIETLCCAT